MNISNSYISNTSSNSILGAALSHIRNKIDTQEEDIEPSVNKTQYIFNTSYSSEFGFRTDENGFFEQDFNMKASLPFDYKINIKSVQSIAKELLKQDEDLSLSKLDITSIINKYYNSLKSVEKEFSTNSNDYLSRAEISKLNQGFSTQNGNISGELIKIYENISDINEIKRQNKILNPLNLGMKIVDFSFEDAVYNNSNNELLKPYMNKDGDISKAGLLMNFIHRDLQTQNENELFIEPIKLNLNAHKNLQNMLEKEGLFEDYVIQQNSKTMSFDLYLYVNGVNKQNTNKDKLENLYNQYISYQRGVNIKEFVNSSSIFSLYTEALSKEFSSLRSSFTNLDEESLQNVSNDIKNLNENYIKQREKQANFSKLIKSYISVMQ